MELLGHQIRKSTEVESGINNLVTEIGKKSSEISGIREAHSEHKGHFEGFLKEVGDIRGRPLFYNYLGTGVGRGPYVELEDGSVKLDLINGIGIHILGHSHPKVMAASLRGGLQDIVMQGHLQANMEYLDLSKKIVEIAGRTSKLKHCWLTTSGSMANENALKMARQKNSPARKIIALESAFAGRTTMMAEVTDNPAFKQGLPSYGEVLRVPFCNKFSDMCKSSCGKDKALNVLKEHVAKHGKDIATFIFEPMLGEGGYRVPCAEFLRPLLGFCREQGIAVWADEIQTFCRTGNFFAHETLGFGDLVDICTIAKTAQAAATLYTDEYNPKPGLIAGTFAGSSSALSAGLEVLQVLDNEGYMGPKGKIQQIHDEFVGMLKDLNETTCKGLLRDAGGMGLMVAVTPLDGSKEKQIALLKSLYSNGLMTFGCGRDPFRLRFLLPAVLKSEDIKAAKKVLEKSILELS